MTPGGSSAVVSRGRLHKLYSGASPRTIAAWVKVPNAPTADNAILHYGTGSGSLAAANFHPYMTGSGGHIGLGNGYG